MLIDNMHELADVSYLVQKMPSWFPGAGFKKYAQEVRPEVGESVKDRPWEEFITDIEVRSWRIRLTTGTRILINLIPSRQGTTVRADGLQSQVGCSRNIRTTLLCWTPLSRW